MKIEQGARSRVRLITVDGVGCVEKRYNARKDEPSVKLAREVAFYQAYEGLGVIPRMVSYRTPDLIVITHCHGDRLIDLVKDGPADLDIPKISRSYGTCAVEFFSHGVAPTDVADPVGTLSDVVERTKRAVLEDPRYQLPDIEASMELLPHVLDADGFWACPMMCKYDWSASNMLIESNDVVCIYDFDTSYVGTRLSFLGDILRSTILQLDWIETREAFLAAGFELPEPELLAAAAHLSRWQVALSSLVDGRFAWPEPEAMCVMLTRLTDRAHALPG